MGGRPRGTSADRVVPPTLLTASRGECSRKTGQILDNLLNQAGESGTVRVVPRQMRVEYPGAIHHAMSSGNRGKAICVDNADRRDFLKTLAETQRGTARQ